MAGITLRSLLEKVRRWRFPLLLAGSILLVGWLVKLGSPYQGRERGTNMEIHFLPEDEEPLIGKASIEALLLDSGLLYPPAAGSTASLSRIEKALESQAFCRSAEAWLDMHGVLRIEYTQRLPVLRIIDNRNNSYYLDTEGKMMPLSSHYTARVTLVSGQIPPFSHNEDSLQGGNIPLGSFLARAVQKYPILPAVGNQIKIGKEGSLVLISRIGGTRIVLGDTSHFERKIKKLNVLYEEILPRRGWTVYDTVFLNFRNQIVANTK
jgi:cell division protein FtsQ